MKEEECLVDGCAKQSLSSHNSNWKNHEVRCAMSLVGIHELDKRWSEDDRDFFHCYRTLCQFYDVLKIVGEDQLDELNDNLGIIDASEYTIEY